MLNIVNSVAVGLCILLFVRNTDTSTLQVRPTASGAMSSPAKLESSCLDAAISKFPFLRDVLDLKDQNMPCAGLANSMKEQLDKIVDDVVNSCKEEAQTIANRVVKHVETYAEALLADDKTKSNDQVRDKREKKTVDSLNTKGDNLSTDPKGTDQGQLEESKKQIKEEKDDDDDDGKEIEVRTKGNRTKRGKADQQNDKQESEEQENDEQASEEQEKDDNGEDEDEDQND